MPDHTERSTTAACIASILGEQAVAVPLEDAIQRPWLAERGLGLVPVADPAAFSWAGHWIAWRPAADGDGVRAVVMFGVPSGVVWDPAGTRDEIRAGAVLAPLDVAAWAPPTIGEPRSGLVEAIVVADRREGPTRTVAEAAAIAGRGFAGDRYADGAGSFASGRPGSALTLVDADVLDEMAAARGAPIDHRRNVVVRGADLNALVGRDFTLGALRCRGSRLCEPCALLDRLNGGGILRPLVHRGGLRADIVEGGTLRVGDALSVS